MSLILNVEILGEFKKLTAATKGAENKLESFAKTSNRISKRVAGAFAAVGLGLGIKAAVDGILESSKAALEDVKSQKLLEQQLKKNAKANDKQVKGAEAFISALSMQVGVADDDLRPALAKLARGTGSVTKAQELLKTALDVSAGTGKPLTTVVDALSKAFNGSKTALNKLAPELKNSKTPLDDLAKSFEGLAAQQADPFAKLKVAVDEIKESIGKVFLPYLEKAASKIGDFVTKINDPKTTEGKMFIGIKDTLKEIIDKVGEFFARFDKTGKGNAMLGFLDTVQKALDGILFTFDLLSLNALFRNFQGAGKAFNQLTETVRNRTIAGRADLTKQNLMQLNVQIGGEKASGAQIVAEINKYRKLMGMPPLK
jgi:hypothetical protein